MGDALVPFHSDECEALALLSSHLTRRVAAQQRWLDG